MKPEELIEIIIERFENNSPETISILDELYLEPVLNYGGKMARKGYQTYRKNWHQDRKFVGILDFKIMNRLGKMEHSRLLERSIGKVEIEDLREIFDGGDPFDLGLSLENLELLSEIQCSFLEQEVNWGTESFQLRTHFGYPEMKNESLKNAVPRDFFMMYFERCNFEIENGSSIDQALKIVSEPQYQQSFVANKMVLMPPITGSGNNRRINSDFLPFLRSNNIGGVDLWINPFVNRINDLCQEVGISPYWNKAFNPEL